MENTLLVAKELNELFKSEHGTDMDEMRMHKLMYFVQRESLMCNNDPLFSSKFQGWKYGPVLVDIRNEYLSGRMFRYVSGHLCNKSKDLILSVYNRYKKLSSWTLSSLSHGEISWKQARKGLPSDVNGTVELRLADMRLDAAWEQLRRKGHIYNKRK